jgi:hypothetical protein
VEVGPAEPAASTRFLNVLLPRLIDEKAKPPAVKLVEAGPEVVAVAVGKTVAVFARDHGPVRSVIVPTTFGGRCLLLDAEPRADYRVAGRTVTADDEGVLAIDNTPAGIVLIEQVDEEAPDSGGGSDSGAT